MHLEQAVAIDPEAAGARRDLGEAYASQGRFDRALQRYSQALTALPDNVFLINRAAWILATSADDRLGNGARGRALAQHAVELTARHDVLSLDTLAAATAELDRFDDAARLADETLLPRARTQATTRSCRRSARDCRCTCSAGISSVKGSREGATICEGANSTQRALAKIAEVTKNREEGKGAVGVASPDRRAGRKVNVYGRSGMTQTFRPALRSRRPSRRRALPAGDATRHSARSFAAFAFFVIFA